MGLIAGAGASTAPAATEAILEAEQPCLCLIAGDVLDTRLHIGITRALRLTNSNTASERSLTPKGQKRIDAILLAAAELFLERGYDDLRLDEVIALTGGSKITLYRHFGNKELLLEAVTEYVCAGYERDLRSLDLTGKDAHASFEKLAKALLDLALSDRQLRFYRLVMGNSGRFPAIGRIWYERGLSTVSAVFKDFLLRHFIGLGLTDTQIGAFADAIQGALVFRLLSEAAVLHARPSDNRINDVLNTVMSVFSNQLAGAKSSCGKT